MPVLDTYLQKMWSENDPDAALMLRVKQGDIAAFTELVEKYKQPVMNLVYRMLRDLTEAEDVAQNVFVQAILPLFWFVLKVFSFLFLYVWVRGTLPRFRYDQLMNYGWRFLLPLAILNIVGTSLWLAYKS